MFLAPFGPAQEMSSVSARVTIPDGTSIKLQLAENIFSQASASELEEMMRFLPPRVFDGKGREGDTLNLIFVAQPADLQRACARAGRGRNC